MISFSISKQTIFVLMSAVFLISCSNKNNSSGNNTVHSNAPNSSRAKVTNVTGNAKVNGEPVFDQFTLGAKSDLFVDQDSSLDLSVHTGLALNDLFRLSSGSAVARFGILNNDVRSSINIDLSNNESSVDYNQLYIELNDGVFYGSTAKRDFLRKEVLSLSTSEVSIFNQFDANFSIEKNDQGTHISVYKGNVSYSMKGQDALQTLSMKSSVLITPSLVVQQRQFVPNESATDFFVY